MFCRAFHRLFTLPPTFLSLLFFGTVPKGTAPRRQALFNDDSWMMDGVVFVLVSAVCVRVCAYV